MDNLAPQEWIERCAQRIVQVDHDIADEEAKNIALDLQRFERTAAMAPEEAVDFVASELGRPDLRFERRSAPRDSSLSPDA
jgi:hypothetical protein